MKYDKKDVPAFQEQVCKKTCVCKGKCIKDGKDDHWFLMCPHYFNWKLGIKTFVAEQLEWERNHPEEVAERHKIAVEKAKAWRKEQREKKKQQKQ